MKAFVERLCPHTLIVRAGPEAHKYGDPWLASCVGVIDGDSVTLKALAVLNLPGSLRATLRALRQEGFTDVRYERHKEGKIMARHPNSKNPIHKILPDPATVTSDAEHAKHVTKAMQLAMEEKIKLSDFHEIPIDDKTDILICKRTTV